MNEVLYSQLISSTNLVHDNLRQSIGSNINSSIARYVCMYSLWTLELHSQLVKTNHNSIQVQRFVPIIPSLSQRHTGTTGAIKWQLASSHSPHCVIRHARAHTSHFTSRQTVLYLFGGSSTLYYSFPLFLSLSLSLSLSLPPFSQTEFIRTFTWSGPFGRGFPFQGVWRRERHKERVSFTDRMNSSASTHTAFHCLY